MAEFGVWTSVEEEKPASEQRVFVHYKNECDKDRTEIAQYIAPFTVKADEFLEDDYDHSCSEYNEADDEFYVVEGWWESSWEADTNWKISREIDYWMPLPLFKTKDGTRVRYFVAPMEPACHLCGRWENHSKKKLISCKDGEKLFSVCIECIEEGRLKLNNMSEDCHADKA